MSNPQRKKVAIVGSGCAGLAALWALNRSPHDVYLYEADDRLGGHTNTVTWRHGKHATLVDTGFIVMNTETYPNFLQFLCMLGVATTPTPMTLSVCRDQGAFEWSGTSLDAVFCQRRNLLSPRMWRMLFDIVRFNQFALDILADHGTVGSDDDDGDLSIGAYLDREGYSDAFRDNYLIPMTAAVWSTPPEKCALAFPARTLVRFLWNHHLLSTVAVRPPWLTVAAGARAYVDAVLAGFPRNHVFLGTPVRSVAREPDGRVRLSLDGGRSAVYDHVILAVHGDDARALLQRGGTATAAEEAILGAFHTSYNEAVLHSDHALLPRARKAWSSWNYMASTTGSASNATPVQVSITYNMNILQHIPSDVFGDVLVSLNPLVPPDPATVQGRFAYRHPLYTTAAVRAQRQLPRIQNMHGISFAGAWTRYGFHEDAFTSGLTVAVNHLGARVPFPVEDATYRRGRAPTFSLTRCILRLLLWLVQVWVVQPLEQRFGVRRAVRPNGVFHGNTMPNGLRTKIKGV